MYMPGIHTHTRARAQMGSQHKGTHTHSGSQTPLPHAKSFWIVLSRGTVEPHDGSHTPRRAVWPCVREETGQKKINTHPWLRSDNWKKIFIKPMKTESSSQTEETMTLGQRGTYTITFVLHSACVSVCVLSEDTATFCFFLCFWSNVQCAHSQILVFTLEHVF